MTDAERRATSWVGTVAIVIVALSVFSHSQPFFSERAFRKSGAYPDHFEKSREGGVMAVVRQPLLERAAAADDAARGMLAGRAVEELGTSEKKALLGHMTTARSWFVASHLAGNLPWLVLTGMAAFVLGARIRDRWNRDDQAPLDLDETRVLSQLRPGKLGVRLPELPLPAEEKGRGLSPLHLRGYRKLFEKRDERTTPRQLRAQFRRELPGLPRKDRADVTQCLRLGVPPLLLQAREELRRHGWLTPLAERLLRITAAHGEWPASIGHHGAGRCGLAEHKADLLMRVLAQLRASRIDEEDAAAVRVLALVHDLGKIISFQRTARGRWQRRDRLHAQHTAKVLLALPEFAREHGHDEERILLAVEFDHNPEAVPLEFRQQVAAISRIVKAADGASVREHVNEAQLVRDAALAVVERFPAMVRSLRINRVPASRVVQGFYEGRTERGEPALVLSEVQFRQQLKTVLSDEQQRALGLWTERARDGSAHPGYAVVAQALMEAEFIPKEVRGIPVDPVGLVSLRSGDKGFSAFFPVDLDRLRAHLGDELDEILAFWSSAKRFPLQIVATGCLKKKALKERIDELKKAEARVKQGRDAPHGRCPACQSPMKPDPAGGPWLYCQNYPRVDESRCGVRFRYENGQADKTCRHCGKDLVVIFRARPKHMGCPDYCKKTKDKRQVVFAVEDKDVEDLGSVGSAEQGATS